MPTATIIDADAIVVLGLRLAGDAALASEVATELRALCRSRNYLEWASGLGQAQPFELVDDEYDVRALRAAGLIEQNRLLVKVNLFRGRVFITDGAWIDAGIRVFPFSDESEALIRHVRSAGLHEWADWVVDLATGCGHNVIGLGSTAHAVALDVNPRALAYLVANRALNGIARRELVAMINDIRDGIPAVVGRGLTGRALFLANMPFAPSPAKAILPLTSNGGRSGADLQLASFQAIQDFADQAGAACVTKAVLMSVTVGDARAQRWQTVEQARRVFGAENVKWILTLKHRLLRVDGVRELRNPAPLRTAMSRSASCRLYTPESDNRARLQDLNSQLADQHEEEGNPDIALGVIEVDLNRGGSA